MINVKEEELSHGLMVDNTLVSGKLVSNMEKAPILVSKEIKSLVFGRMEKK